MSRFYILLWISAGGIVGTICRFVLTIIIEQNKTTSFPVSTLLINFIGCFIFGFVSELSTLSIIIKPELKLALTTGFAGAFTTFSTLMFDNYQLGRDSQFLMLISYSALSFIGGAICMYSGILLARLLIK